MIKRMIIMLVVVGMVLGAIFGWLAFKGMMMKKYMAAAGAPVQTISTIKAEYQDWQPKLEAVGTLRAVKGTDLSAEVSGIVESIHFESDDDVKAGTTLVQLRAEDDIAKLHALEATATLAQITYQRDEKQLKAQVISQAAFDIDSANLASAQAQVVEQRAIVNKKTIRAPFAGHIGIRAVDIGQYLNPGTTIVTLQQLDPIYVDFNMPEQALTQVQVGQKVTIKSDAHADKSFEGEISAINPKVEESTRNVQVRATLPNPDHLLLPGMYATINIESGTAQHYLTLPQTVITYNPYGNTVYIVDNTDASKPVAKQTFVTTGTTRGDQVAVLSGLNEGDEVVTTGQLKLRNGAPVVVSNDIQPANDINPKPQDH